MKHFKRLVLLALLMLFGGVTSGYATKNDPIRVGFFPNITHAQALIGQATHQFQSVVGTRDIDWRMFNAGPQEIEALLAGEIDLGYIGPGPAINGFAKTGGGLRIIAGAANAGAVLVAGKGLKIGSVSDLQGKKVAVPQFGNTQDLCLRALLKRYRLRDVTKGGNVQIIQVSNPDMLTLIERGDIDSAFLPEPWASLLIHKAHVQVILDWNRVWRNGNYPSTVLIARTAFLKANPKVVSQFLKAHLQITNELNRDQVNAKKLVNRQLLKLTRKSLEPEILDDAFGRLKFTCEPERTAIEEFAVMSYQAGFLHERVKVDGLCDLGWLQRLTSQKQ